MAPQKGLVFLTESKNLWSSCIWGRPRLLERIDTNISVALNYLSKQKRKTTQAIYNYQFYVCKYLPTLLHKNVLVWKSKQARPGNGWKMKPFHTSWGSSPQEQDRWQLSRSSRSRTGREARLLSSWGHIRADLGKTSLQPSQIFRLPDITFLRCPEQESGIIGLFSQRDPVWELQAAALICYLRLFPENEV